MPRYRVAPATPSRLRTCGVLAAAIAAFAASATDAAADTLTVAPDADAYVSQSSPTKNYGGSSALVTDANPLQTTYIRFPAAVGGTLNKATLRIYSSNSSSAGFAVHPVSNTTWSETGITAANAPAVSSTVISQSGPVSRKSWVSVDVTPAVTGAGDATVAVTTPSSSALQLAAREAGASRAPQLILDYAPAPAPAPSPTPTPTPTPAPTSTPAPSPLLPYDLGSPWNTPIPADVAVDPKSATFIGAIADNGLPLTSDPDQYTIPVYATDNATPLRTVKLSGYFSSYDAGDNSRKGYGYAPTITGVPVPDSATAGVGSDGQIVLWDASTGTEYGFWQFAPDGSGGYTATNGYRYHTTAGYFGRFADGLAGRGAGMPYFAGLVRKWEIDQGHVDHALAFAYDSPSSDFRYPASKSDGGNFGGVSGVDLPEGARLQLNPNLTDADFDAWGLPPAAKVLARAMQRYGMYVVDHSGSSKIFLEARTTAGWDSTITRSLVSAIPWSQFRVVAAPPAG